MNILTILTNNEEFSNKYLFKFWYSMVKNACIVLPSLSRGECLLWRMFCFLLLVVSGCTKRERDQFNFCWSRKLFGPKKCWDIFLFPTILMIKPISSNPVLNHSIGLISPRRFEVLQQLWRWGRENYRNISLTAWPLLPSAGLMLVFAFSSPLSISVGDVRNCKSCWSSCVWSYKVKCNGEGERMELFIVFKVIFY